MKNLDHNEERQLIADVQYNCDVSDARDHGIYSMCSMVLKLRNLYKWQQGMEPWMEPEPAKLLDWIESQENYWAAMADNQFRSIVLQGKTHGADQVEEINGCLSGSKFFFGAGYGRSLKAIFFLAEVLETKIVEGLPVIILGRERAREMAAPFAMVQDGQIVIRREPLRFFLWDHLQEMRGSCRSSYRRFLESYGIIENGRPQLDRLPEVLDDMVAREMDLFIYHEVGEVLQQVPDSDAVKEMIGHFRGTVIEFVSRAVKDVLADTHSQGILGRLLTERRASTLALYTTFLDGLREKLFPQMYPAWERFAADGDWDHVEEARGACRQQVLPVADEILKLARATGARPDEEILAAFNDRILRPLNLEIPAVSNTQ